MKPLNYLKVHAVRHCTQLPGAAIKRILVGAGLAAIMAAPALADSNAVAPESVAQASWRSFMVHNPAAAAGCFRASYPNLDWERVACSTAQPRVHPTPRKLASEVRQ